MAQKTNYSERLNISLDSNDIKLYTMSNLIISNGYNRIVIGGRGPYIEFTEEQIIKESMKIPEKSLYRLYSDCYYIEFRTIDYCNVKIYYQKKCVDYADYKIGYYYISPFDLKSDKIDKLIDPITPIITKNSSKFFK